MQRQTRLSQIMNHSSEDQERTVAPGTSNAQMKERPIAKTEIKYHKTYLEEFLRRRAFESLNSKAFKGLLQIWSLQISSIHQHAKRFYCEH